MRGPRTTLIQKIVVDQSVNVYSIVLRQKEPEHRCTVSDSRAARAPIQKKLPCLGFILRMGRVTH